MTRYRLAIFDFDGTLADSLPWFRSSFQETIARFGLAPVSPEKLEAMRSTRSRSGLPWRGSGAPCDPDF